MLRSLCLAASTISSTESPHQRSLLELLEPTYKSHDRGCCAAPALLPTQLPVVNTALT